MPLKETRELLGDKAYDTNDVRELLASRGIIATIPSKSNRSEPLPYDERSYKGRHLVENAFMDVKQFRGVYTRFCKLAIMFEGLVHLVGWVVGTRDTRRGASPYHVSGEQGALVQPRLL